MHPDLSAFWPEHCPLPVSYSFFTASPVGALERRQVKVSGIYQTSRQLINPFYKNISRCVTPFSL